MFSKKHSKWLFITYGSFVLLGLVILLVVCGTNLASWGSLYGWLLSIPFAFIAIFSYTWIPRILLSLSKKRIGDKSKAVLFLSISLYILRYIFYITPILIAAGVNNFKIDGVFNVIPTIVAIILIPISSIALNYLIFWIEYYKNKKNQKEKEYVPTGDSLKPN
ncbi:MG406 family protein [Mycoplasmoides pirum]|uniref:MG406 family protein n=1 Tax=Mycoplasmoides pirum TaxID=2122 RepID=UPI00047F0833|nr:MG406 family protein [Mycoplasmoides pirum]